jgi:hypothetical protein
LCQNDINESASDLFIGKYDACQGKPARSIRRAINRPAESSSSLKAAYFVLAGFSLLWLSDPELIPGDQSGY